MSVSPSEDVSRQAVFGFSAAMVFVHIDLILSMPRVIKTLVSQYAECYPIVFEDRTRKLCGLFAGSKYVGVVENQDPLPQKWLFHSYDYTSGIILFSEWSNKRCSERFSEKRELVCINDILLTRTMPKEHTYLIPALAGRDGSEYAVQCVFDNPSAVAERSPRLLVTFSWGWLQPNVYYAFSQNGQSHKLKWTFPPETCSYVDGWVTQLYYFNEQLLLITEDAIYVAAYKPFTDPIVSIQEKDWKVVVLLQQAQK